MQNEKQIPLKTKISSAAKYVRDNAPKLFFAALSLALLALAVRIVCRVNPTFADFFVRYIAGGVRFLMASVSNIIPFSIAEIIVMLSPFILAFLIYLSVRFSRDKRKAFRYAVIIISIIALLYFLFVFTFATGYHTSPIADDFDLTATEITPTELKNTALWLAEEAGKYVEDFEYIDGKKTQMPFSWDEMNEKLNVAYKLLNEKYDFVLNYYTRSKPVIFSEAMSYTSILGVHTFFTGEANVNTAFPDYTTVFTAAHEMAHQRGVARENEANFVAFMVCVSSDDRYIRYCGYVNMYEYVMNALYRANSVYHAEVLAATDNRVRAEIGSYAETYDKYDDTPVHDVSEAVNDTYLQIQGTEGTESYGMVVDLAVAYYRSAIAKIEQ